MKSIDEKKSQLLKLYAKKNCGLDDPSLCGKDSCACNLQAEIRALINTIIPEGFQRYRFSDFDGTDPAGNKVLGDETARRAKEQLARFIWGNKSVKEIATMDHAALMKDSILGDRIKNGCSAVIHGATPKYSGKQALGKTFIASLLTREAISLRCLAKEYSRIRYAWVEFSTLLHVLKDDPEKEVDYLDAGWLVVDNIGDFLLNGSDRQRAYNNEKLDAFFFHRREHKQSTVLVFKFDIDRQRGLVHDAFGSAINEIIDSKKTMVISLTDQDREENG